MPGQLKTACPHLGLIHDAASHMNFPSLSNQCLKCKKPGSPNFDHQQNYCLSKNYVDCVLAQSDRKIPMPIAIGVSAPSPYRLFWFISIPALLILVAVLILYRSPAWTGNGYGASALAPAVGLSTPITLLASPTDRKMVSETASLPAAVGSTPLPSQIAMPFVSPHGFEVTKIPSGSDQVYLIHIVAQGETLDVIAANYATTVQAIIAVNYELTPPVWVDYPIVIPLDTTDVAGLPSFTVYIVEEYEIISSKELAEILAMDAADLEFYNVCSADCQFAQGDVLLVPQHP